MEQQTITLAIPMKDGTTQHLTTTRTDIEQWLTEHRKAKLICPDTDELVSRFVHAYELDYRKSIPPKPKGERGGARKGAGRKPKGVTEKLQYSWRVSRDVWEILQRQENKTDYIERAIRFYARREDC